MSKVTRTVASLRVFGEKLEPDDITRLLGCSPARSHRAGDGIEVRGEVRGHRSEGLWLRSVPDATPGDLDRQIADLFADLPSDARTWNDLTSSYSVDVFLGLFLTDHNEGVSMTPSTLKLLSERGLEVRFDIYSAATE